MGRILLALLLCGHALLLQAQPPQSGEPATAATTQPQTGVATEIYRTGYQTPEALIGALKPLFNQELLFSRQDKQVLLRGPSPLVREALSLLEQLDHPPQQLRIQLSDNPGQSPGKHNITYSTTGERHKSFLVEESQVLILQRGRLAQSITGAGPWWVQVESVPIEQDSLQLTVRTTGDSVYLQIDASTLENGQFTRIQRTVTGQRDQWIPLSGRDEQQNQRVYSTAASTGTGKATDLFVRVSLP